MSDTGEKTAEAGSARIVSSYEGEQTASGAFDLADGTGVLDLSERRKMIINPDFVYEQISDDLLIESSRGPKWLRWDSSVMGGAMLLDPIATSTTELFAFFSAAGAPTEIGEGEERGEPVTRYAATVDVERFLATAAARRPRRARRALRLLA